MDRLAFQTPLQGKASRTCDQNTHMLKCWSLCPTWSQRALTSSFKGSQVVHCVVRR